MAGLSVILNLIKVIDTSLASGGRIIDEICHGWIFDIWCTGDIYIYIYIYRHYIYRLSHRFRIAYWDNLGKFFVAIISSYGGL